MGQAKTVLGRCLLAAAALLAGAGGAWAEGLPQLDVKNFAPQLVWLAISFTLLYLLMAKVALPRVAEVLEDRQRRIDENLKRAEALKAEAETAAEAYQKLIADARSNAQGLMRDIRSQASAEASKRQQELGETLAGQIKDAEGRIAAARDKAVADLQAMAAEVAAAAVERLLGEKPDMAAVEAAVARVAKERA